MPDGDFFFPVGPPQELTPLPGQGASDPRFNRLAAQQEELDRAGAELARQRGIGDRGTDSYALRLAANDVARQAKSLDDLANLLRKHLYSSHVVGSREDAKRLIDTALAAYRQMHPGGDPDLASYTGAALVKEYDDKQQEARRRQIGQQARKLEQDPILRARLDWQDRVNGLAQETGLEPAYVEEFLLEYDELSRPPFPGRVDPRGIPFIQVEPALFASAKLIKDWILPFTPAGAVLMVYETVSGKDFLTQERLPTWERVLNIVLIVAPFAGKPLKGPVKQAARSVGQLVKGAASTLTRGAKQIARLALEIRASARAMLRFVGKLARLPLDKVRALLARIEAARKFGKAVQLAREEAQLGRQVDEALAELRVVEADPSRLSRTASGVIDDGRVLSRTQSGTILPKAAAPAAKSAAKALSKAAQSLIAKGYLPEAIEALENMGVKVTQKLAAQLGKLGDTGRDFLNLFHRSKGFHRVVGDLAKGGNKAVGAEFVMRYATRHPDILAKVRADPLLVAFEWGQGIKKTRRFGDIFAREVDIVVRGERTLGLGETIYNELKNWTAKSLKAAKNKKLAQQLVRDVALLKKENIRWVFNSAKIADKGEIVEVFVQVIQRDAYLSKAWGTDLAKIRADLAEVIQLFP